MAMKRVVVGSTNPVKIQATQSGFQKIFSDSDCGIEISGVSVASGIRDQPYGDEETVLGAKNRATAAYHRYQEVNGVRPDYAVGLEGGVSQINGNLECFAWIAIFDGNTFGTAKSASFLLPKRISDLVLGGMELGDADDAVFGTVNSKQNQGTIGQLTRGRITRAEYYEPVVILAFVPFSWPELYPQQQSHEEENHPMESVCR
jgi:inosine/xanthosine triphosphatase